MNLNEYHENDIEVEFITIVEGPPPNFASISSDWPASLHEGSESAMFATCQLRTMDGGSLLDRCRGAWREGRPVHLDYPDGEGGRQEADIVAARVESIDQGEVLNLWVCL